MSPKETKRPVMGWREWVEFPTMAIPRVKAKVDTGARTSALHAFDIELIPEEGRSLVRFKLHPYQRDSKTTVQAEAPLVEMRKVRASSGHTTLRPVIMVEVELLGRRWPIELTLTSRDEMGFRMLLGRQAIRGRFAVDPGRSFIGGRPARRKRASKGVRATKTAKGRRSVKSAHSGEVRGKRPEKGKSR